MSLTLLLQLLLLFLLLLLPVGLQLLHKMLFQARTKEDMWVVAVADPKQVGQLLGLFSP